MAQQTIGIGATPNDGTGDPLRTALSKSNDNFTELYGSLAAKAPLASPPFTGTPTAPTAAPGTNTTQLATTAFVNAIVTGLLKLKGDTDASGNPNYPAASKGDAYVVTVAGKIGGASGVNVDIGDTYVARIDNAGGTQAAVGASWFVLEHNLAGALLSANNLSDLANAGTARTNLGLAIGTNVQAFSAALALYSAISPSSNVQSLLAAANYAAMRTLLGLVVGTDVQAYDADLQAIAALTSAADKLPYATGAGTWALANFTATGRLLAAAANAQAVCAAIGAPWTVAQSAVATPLTGTTTETTLATIVIPAGAMGPNGQVEIEALWSMTNSANIKSVRLYFGAVGVHGTNLTTSATYQHGFRIANRNSASSQVAQGTASQGYGSSGLALVTGAVNTGSAVNLTLTGQLANTGETITLESYIVRITYGA